MTKSAVLLSLSAIIQLFSCDSLVFVGGLRMLSCQHPRVLSDEAVSAVIAKESPEYFADTHFASNPRGIPLGSRFRIRDRRVLTCPNRLSCCL